MRHATFAIAFIVGWILTDLTIGKMNPLTPIVIVIGLATLIGMSIVKARRRL